MSLVATFDDLMRCMAVLIDGTAEEGLKSIFLERNVIISILHKFTEFLKFVKVQEECRMQWLAAIQEAQRLQRELDASLQNMADLEAKLYHARKLIESEHKARKEAENERDNIVSILGIIISGIIAPVTKSIQSKALITSTDGYLVEVLAECQCL